MTDVNSSPLLAKNLQCKELVLFNLLISKLIPLEFLIAKLRFLQSQFLKLIQFSHIVLLSGSALILLPEYAAAHNSLKMTLTSSKVVTTADGRQVYIPARTAEVGTIIQYKATYFNPSDKPLHNITLILPIPTNTEFTGEAYPLSAQGSVDYYNYQDLPLLRINNGKLVIVPLAEYKSLRWNIRYIPPRKSVEVSFNTVVK